MYLPMESLGLVCWAASLFGNRVYASHRTLPLRTEVTMVVRVTLLATVAFLLVIFVLRLDALLLGSDRISRSWVVLFGSFGCLFLLVEKLGLRLVSRYFRAQGFNYRTLLLIGTNRHARRIARMVAAHSYWGYKTLGFVETRPDGEAKGVVEGEPVLGRLEDLSRIVQENVVDDVIFAVSHRELGELEPYFLLLQEQGIRTRFSLDLMPHGFSKVELEEFDGTPLLSFARTPTSYPLMLLKRTVDVAVALVLLLLGLPIILAVAMAIKVTSSGAVLYRQTRCGLNGRQFTLYKFRTMFEGAHDRRSELQHLNEMDGPAFKVRRDPRVTLFGRFLRKFSLDELPQLWNVLRGDMSMVGPRPPIPEEVAQYARWQRRRLSMKPGLTCLWQISGRNDLDFNRWMESDPEDIASWSPLLDLKILVKTIPVVLSGRGAS